MKIFFTSDTHFSHRNIIKYCERPFLVESETYDNYSQKSVDFMNQKLIENWNNVVSQDDLVYHLGDVSFGNFIKTKQILNQLNGHINLVIGNHDKTELTKMERWTYVEPYMETVIDN